MTKGTVTEAGAVVLRGRIRRGHACTPEVYGGLVATAEPRPPGRYGGGILPSG